MEGFRWGKGRGRDKGRDKGKYKERYKENKEKGKEDKEKEKEKEERKGRGRWNCWKRLPVDRVWADWSSGCSKQKRRRNCAMRNKSPPLQE